MPRLPLRLLSFLLLLVTLAPSASPQDASDPPPVELIGVLVTENPRAEVSWSLTIRAECPADPDRWVLRQREGAIRKSVFVWRFEPDESDFPPFHTLHVTGYDFEEWPMETHHVSVADVERARKTGRPIRLEFHVRPRNTISGVMRDRDGEPMPEEYVQLGVRPSSDGHRKRMRTWTDGAGAYEFRGVPPGYCRLRASRHLSRYAGGQLADHPYVAGGIHVRQNLVCPDHPPKQDHLLYQALVIRLDEAINGFATVITCDLGRMEATPLPLADSDFVAYRFPKTEAGRRVHIRVVADDGRHAFADTTLAGGLLDVELQPAPDAVRVQVVDADGEAAAGTPVRLLVPTTDPTSRVPLFATTSDADGFVELPVLPAEMAAARVQVGTGEWNHYLFPLLRAAGRAPLTPRASDPDHAALLGQALWNLTRQQFEAALKDALADDQESGPFHAAIRDAAEDLRAAKRAFDRFTRRQ